MSATIIYYQASHKYLPYFSRKMTEKSKKIQFITKLLVSIFPSFRGKWPKSPKVFSPPPSDFDLHFETLVTLLIYRTGTYITFINRLDVIFFRIILHKRYFFIKIGIVYKQRTDLGTLLALSRSNFSIFCVPLCIKKIEYWSPRLMSHIRRSNWAAPFEISIFYSNSVRYFSLRKERESKFYQCAKSRFAHPRAKKCYHIRTASI